MTNQFIQLYRNLNFISQEGRGLPIHRACANREACWEDAAGRFPQDNEEWSHISKPWIGPEYEKLRLAVIGINLNGYGGINALIELTEDAKDLIKEGWRRLRFGSSSDEYAGSFLWHRMGCYAVAIGEHYGAIKPTWGDDGYPIPGDVSRAFDLISFVEHIKCSPVGDLSKPTPAMWGFCGKYILRDELSLLQPTQLLVLGTSDNAWFLQERVLDSTLKDNMQFGSVTRGKGEINGSPVTVWTVPHPQSFGGISKSILDDLRNVHQTKASTSWH
jgi:hypothetical protein